MKYVPHIIKHLIKNVNSDFKYFKYYKKNQFNKNGIAADVIRLTHSIEKGLSLKKIRQGFGHKKQTELMEMIGIIEKNNNNYYDEIIKMAVNALNSYLEYHKEIGYRDDYFDTLENFVYLHREYLQSNYGGTKILNKEDLKFNINEVERVFKTRHSIRDFDNKPVDEEIIKKAIEIAQSAPSACNRQGYRCYVVDKSKANGIKNWLSGVGGFSDNLDKVILITGKISSYRFDENYQYIVSASIFGAYLSLALHLYGIGACIIQRPVVWTKDWENIKKEYKIEKDEQIVLCIGIGMLKDKTKVPISHRLSIDEICKFV